MRSDVYFLVRTSDESTDKIEGSVIWHSWSNHEIFVLLIKRIESYFGKDIDEKELLKTAQEKLARYLNPIMEESFNGQGHWENVPIYRVLMSLIRKRPRDLVKLCTLAARRARQRQHLKIKSIDLKESFEEYSQGRLQDTINEFKSELPEVQRLLMGMKPSKRNKTTRESYLYTTDSLLTKIKNIEEQGKFKFSSGTIASPRDLAGFMYKINFLTATKDVNGKIERRYFEEHRFLQNQFVDFGFDWEVHPAYRWALQPDDISSIFKDLRINSDD